MKRFFNSQDSIVTEALCGLVKSQGDSPLAILDGFPHIKAVVRTDWDRSKVAIVSGGGAGHEPAHAGYIGPGMLTAAISGDVFASPSVDAVLAGILAVTGEAGCLLIVKNYTGDRLNFGLAAERAKNLGYNVEMVIVSDDIALPEINQPRGIAGTLFVHKLAGYFSEQGLPLEQLKQKVEQASTSISSIGLAYGSCVLPGQSSKSENHEAELGLGIHGEPGVEKIDISSAREAVEIVIGRLEEKLQHSDEPIAVLINNLGSVTSLEMAVIANEVLSSSLAKKIDLVFGPESFVTALNMHGFSLSVIPLREGIKSALTSPVPVRSWHPGFSVGQLISQPLHNAVKRLEFEKQPDELTAQLIRSVCKRLIEEEDALNILDAKVGDGDTGTTFGNAARAVLESLETSGLPLRNLDQLFLSFGQILSTSMGGSSGVLLSIFFTSSGNSLKKGEHLPEALMHGIEIVQLYGRAKSGDRTMLDAAIPAFEALANGFSIHDAANKAEIGAMATAQMQKANAGRSSYLRSDSLDGVKDPGAVAISTILRNIAQQLE